MALNIFKCNYISFTNKITYQEKYKLHEKLEQFDEIGLGKNHGIYFYPEEINVKPGKTFTLDAFGFTDPDGDSFSFHWFNYPETGTDKKPIKVNETENAHMAHFTAPLVDKEETFILY